MMILGDGGSDGDMHLLRDGKGDGNGADDDDVDDGDMSRLRSGAAISLTIAASMDGGRLVPQSALCHSYESCKHNHGMVEPRMALSLCLRLEQNLVQWLRVEACNP
ncbi:hypothetical protein Tco_1271876 [Tanacetum coccineum]